MTKLYLVRDGFRIYKSFLTAEEAEQIGNMPNCDIAFVSDVMVIGEIFPKDDEITYVVIKNHTFYFINVWKGVESLYDIFDDSIYSFNHCSVCHIYFCDFHIQQNDFRK